MLKRSVHKIDNTCNKLTSITKHSKRISKTLFETKTLTKRKNDFVLTFLFFVLNIFLKICSFFFSKKFFIYKPQLLYVIYEIFINAI